MGGAWQHYLPAGYLGGFSVGTERRLRQRTVWVARRGRAAVYEQRVANLAAAHNIYTLTTPGRDPADLVDRVWSSVEVEIARAIRVLVECRADAIPARTWVTALAPFVAQVLVRGVDFGPRYIERLRRVHGESDDSLLMRLASSSDEVNLARIEELRRVLPAAMRAEWTVAHTTGKTKLVATDVGRALFVAADGSLCVAVPLRPDAALFLRMGTHHPNMRPASKTEWEVAPIDRIGLDDDEATRLNERIVRAAHAEAYAQTRAGAEEIAHMLGEDALPIQLGEPIFFGRSADEWLPYADLFRKTLAFIAVPPWQRVEDPSLPEEVRVSWRRRIGALRL